MRKFATSVLLVAFALLMVSTAWAAYAPTPYITEKPVKKANQPPEGRINFVPPPYPTPINELDEPQIGDTLSVRLNYRDQQHNSAFTRMITVDNTDPANPLFHLVMLTHDTEGAAPRYVRYMRLVNDENGDPIVDPDLAPATGPQVGSVGAGYNVISRDPSADGAAFMTFHNDDGTGWAPMIAWESQWVPNFFEGYTVDQYENSQILWPQIAMANYSGNLYAHEISNGYADDGHEDWTFYSRLTYDAATSSFTNSTPDGTNHMVVTTSQGALSNIPIVSSDGSRVVIANTNQRVPMGLEPTSELEWASSDIVYYSSDNGGDNFNFDAGVNVTNFIAPDADALPDTVAAEKDTMRAYAEVDGIIDDDLDLHLAFNTHFFYYYQGSATYTARSWYWNETDDLFVQLADGSFWNNATPSAWEQVVSHTQLYKDEDTGILWAMWVQHGEPGDTLYIPEEDIALGLDCTDDALANTDIYISASPPGEANGKLWTKGVNVTNTRTMDTLLVAGESRSERDPSLAYESDGDDLHLFYTLDRDGGISIITGGDGEGDITLNEMIYHRIPKQALIDSFEARGEWMPNYPMHVDSTGFWWDQGEYMWEEFGGFFTVWPRDPESVQDGFGLAPEEFELQQNYPNPFNPSTSIRFDLASRADVRLAVYDVMGREVATLVDRQMDAGQHSVTFFADELPSGVYFYRLTSGEATKVRKMVLMK